MNGQSSQLIGRNRSFVLPLLLPASTAAAAAAGAEQKHLAIRRRRTQGVKLRIQWLCTVLCSRAAGVLRRIQQDFADPSVPPLLSQSLSHLRPASLLPFPGYALLLSLHQRHSAKRREVIGWGSSSPVSLSLPRSPVSACVPSFLGMNEGESRREGMEWITGETADCWTQDREQERKRE